MNKVTKANCPSTLANSAYKSAVASTSKGKTSPIMLKKSKTGYAIKRQHSTATTSDSDDWRTPKRTASVKQTASVRSISLQL